MRMLINWSMLHLTRSKVWQRISRYRIDIILGALARVASSQHLLRKVKKCLMAT